MPNNTILRLESYINRLDLDYIYRDITYSLLKDSDNLIVNNFSERKQHYINYYCDGNPFSFLVILEELTKNDIIYYDKDFDRVILTGLFDSYLRAASFSRNCFKRKYRIKNLSLDRINATKDYKKGFRVPSSIMPYLTGEPLSEIDRKTLLRSNPEAIYMEELRRSLPKEVIRVYCAFISLADKDGFIECDNSFTIYQSFVNEFGKDSFNLQSWYNSVRKLIALDLISLTPTGYQVMKIMSQNKDRYVLVPFVVFEKEFKHLEISSIRMFFEIIFSLNNGENYNNGKFENLKEHKAFYVKFSGTGMENREAREKIKRTMLLLRKRYAGELIRSLIGKGQILALRKYFDFEVLPGSVFQIKIKSAYYIPKDIDYIQDILPLKQGCSKKIKILKKFFIDNNYKIDNAEITSLWKVIRNYSRYKFKKVLSAIQSKIQSDTLNVSALHLYASSI